MLILYIFLIQFCNLINITGLFPFLYRKSKEELNLFRTELILIINEYISDIIFYNDIRKIAC